MVDFDSNEKLVYFICNKYFKKYYRLWDDIVQCGNLGLWKACLTFDGDKKSQFSSYASKCIINEIGMFLRKERKHECVYSLEYDLQDTIEEAESERVIERGCDLLLLKSRSKHKDIITRIVDGDTKAKIAREEGISKKRLNRMLKDDAEAVLEFVNE